jgi:predicted porin
LAALAATSAFAQNAVSLYGTLDLGAHSAEYLKNDASVVKRTGYAQGGHDTSRWGLTGKEDLGGGLTAEFKIESQIGQHPRAGLGGTGITTAGAASVTNYSYTNGAPEGKGNGYTLDATVLGNRELWLALSNTTGTTLKAGFGVTALRSLAVETDAAGSNNYGNLVGHIVGGIRREGIRVDQAFGPLNVSAEVFGNQQTVTGTNGDTATGTVRVGKGYTYAAQYKQGPWNVGYGYDEARSSTPVETGAKMGTNLGLADVTAATAADSTVKTKLLAGSYNAGVATAFVQIFQQEAITESAAGTGYANGVNAGKFKGNSYGVRVPVGAFTPFAQIYSGKNQVGVAANTAEDRKVNGQSFGVRYDVSKRTYTYLNTGYLKTDASTQGSDNLKFKQTGAGLVHYF